MIHKVSIMLESSLTPPQLEAALKEALKGRNDLTAPSVLRVEECFPNWKALAEELLLGGKV